MPYSIIYVAVRLPANYWRSGSFCALAVHNFYFCHFICWPILIRFIIARKKRHTYKNLNDFFFEENLFVPSNFTQLIESFSANNSESNIFYDFLPLLFSSVVRNFFNDFNELVRKQWLTLFMCFISLKTRPQTYLEKLGSSTSTRDW